MATQSTGKHDELLLGIRSAPLEDSPPTPPMRYARGTQEIPMHMRDEDVIAIGHDLRGPVSVIGLEVAMLEDKLPALTQDAKQALGRIARNLKYLDNLLQDLLDLAAIDTARFELDCKRTELCGLVAEVVDRMVPSHERGRVNLTISGTIPVMADTHRLERVIANLVHNALKYAPRPAEVSVSVDVHGDRARVDVVDHGIGMPPDEASRVFEKFRRAPATKHCGGSGLGLYVSRKIIEAHRGRIGVESVFGKGSRFYFELPVLSADPL